VRACYFGAELNSVSSLLSLSASGRDNPATLIQIENLRKDAESSYDFFAALRLCGFAALRLCGFAALREIRKPSGARLLQNATILQRRFRKPVAKNRNHESHEYDESEERNDHQDTKTPRGIGLLRRMPGGFAGQGRQSFSICNSLKK